MLDEEKIHVYYIHVNHFNTKIKGLRLMPLHIKHYHSYDKNQQFCPIQRFKQLLIPSQNINAHGARNCMHGKITYKVTLPEITWL